MSLDLAAASAAALTDLRADTQPATPAPVEASTPTEAAPVAAEAPVDAIPVESPAPPEAELEEEIVHNGTPVRLPKSELKKLAQMGFDYTQKTMTLAEQRREVEALRAQVQQQQADWQAVMSDPAKLRELVQWAAQQQGIDPATAADPTTEVPTTQQVESLIQARLADVERQTQTKIARAQYELETHRLEQEYSTAITSHIAEILKTNPLLAEVEGIEQVLKAEAAAQVGVRMQANPNDPIPLKDTLQLLSKAAQRRSEKLEAAVKGRLKTVAVQQASVMTTGSEPAGGSPPLPPPAKPLKLGSKELRDLVIADLSGGRS